jgi:uncharacterized protein
MNLYLDTSALVKLYVSEPGSRAVEKQLRAYSRVATSRVAYPEARAALARRHREGGLTEAELRRAVADLGQDMAAFVVVELLEQVAHRAGELAERHRLRGFDAVHLASALELSDLVGSGVTFCSFDRLQTEAALQEGLTVDE